MASLSTVRAALASRVDTIPGLTALARMPGSISPPMAVVVPGAGTFVTYGDSMSGTVRLSLAVVLYVTYSHQDGSQDALDAYLADSGSQSVMAAVAADPTLGGVVEFAGVTEARNYGIVNVANVDYLSCDLGVDIGVL